MDQKSRVETISAQVDSEREIGITTDSSESQKSANGETYAEKTSENATDANIVDWDGADDPENPQNWSSKKRWTIISLVSVITFNQSVFGLGIINSAY